MFGWRARIGCIHPRKGQLHTSMIEMKKVMPEGVYLNDVFLDGPTSQAPEHLLDMFPQLEPTAREVAKIGVDLIIQVGAPICLAQGPGGDQKIIDLIEQATGVPATTCVTSMVKGLQRIDVHQVVVVRPCRDRRSAGNGYREAGRRPQLCRRVECSEHGPRATTDQGLRPFAYHVLSSIGPADVFEV